ncbi:DUF2059 domain-containing protein [Pseudoalteromonas luteoviolacea]|uniref:Uncharacterized protein in bacteria (DUF2059) n=1 Tax=Pseudoalteromonas luteoviolacea (strain 2ta16) TaxID=1353533 RepID=V4HXY1_PSEL2|nr:DUF2059 domain-containing protein [Pseudoalteromonas luteoviolacea]ESP94668.1 uncharacterized protein in bacteria (DUF2059) [Pseudoalteromonas luteoviolacea 2ta16]KZN43467.1 hypothetical protein N483_09225 [Pseudoalteromonas luteoviolacea NCIMB 1944]
MNKLFIIFSMLFSISSSANEIVEEILQLEGGKAEYKKVIEQNSFMMRSFDFGTFDADGHYQLQDLETEFKNKQEKLKEKYLSWDVYKANIINAYENTYTEQELLGLRDFLRSPIGKSILEKRHQLFLLSGQSNQRNVEKYINENKKLWDEFGKRLDQLIE